MGLNDSGQLQLMAADPDIHGEADQSHLWSRPAERLALPAEDRTVPLGRRLLGRWLNTNFGEGHPAIADTLQAVSEVLTNAVAYGCGSDVELSYRIIPAGIEVTVTNDRDTDECRPQTPCDVADDDENGRGLALVEAYSRDWGTEQTADGRTLVWFQVSF